jgi:hypothetical protein
MAGSFTGLESGILDLIVRSAEAEIAPSLTHLIATSLVTGRENTGHGFFTDIKADRTAPPVLWRYRLIDGPSIRVDVSGRVLFMGTILWLDDSYPSCLEGFQYAPEDGGEIDLHDHDLENLKLLGLMET